MKFIRLTAAQDGSITLVAVPRIYSVNEIISRVGEPPRPANLRAHANVWLIDDNSGPLAVRESIHTIEKELERLSGSSPDGR